MILKLLAALLLLAVGFWYLIFYLRKGPITATIHFENGDIYEFPRIFKSFTEFDEWEEEVLKINESRENKIVYIDYKFV